MIISLRGTNGAGKSTIVRTIMRDYIRKEPVTSYHGEKRKKPWGYKLYLEGASTEELAGPSLNLAEALFVPGHYEIANGGIDTLPNLDMAYEMISEFHEAGFSVLYEGKNMSDGLKRIAQFDKQMLWVILINTPLDVCISSVRERGHRIKESTIEKLYDKTHFEYHRLVEQKYNVLSSTREKAVEQCRRLLLI